MNTSVIEPLVPSDVDLTDFSFMPLDVRRLRDSRLAATASGDEFMAWMMLLCASWHQRPAGSLPDDDVELARLAGFGRVVKEWHRVRTGALYGWVRCSDGRLYHEIVAAKAVEAWESKLQHHWRKECDRLRKENKRRQDASLEKLNIPEFESWRAARNSGGSPLEFHGNADGTPAENALKGQGQGDLTDPNGSVTGREALMERSVRRIADTGQLATHAARTFLGGLCKRHGDDAVHQKLLELELDPKVEPRSWLKAALQGGLNGTGSGHRSARSGADRVEAANPIVVDPAIDRYL